MRLHALRLFVLVCLIGAVPGFAQTQDPRQTQDPQESQQVQQLKEKLQQLEQAMQELKGQISAIEQAQKPGQAQQSVQQQAQQSAPKGETVTVQSGQPVPTEGPTGMEAPPSKEAVSTFQIYGYVMTDAIYDFNQNDPKWFDVMRPTKLPAVNNEFFPDGKMYFSARQTRFGVKSSTPTRFGELKTIFEFELFGTGDQAGQTIFRLRHAYGELGHFGAGQTWSPFMDIDVFPNSLEYWGPNGMPFFRNIQVRWMPIMGKRSHVIIALERPGASADQGVYQDRIELAGVKPYLPAPDLSGNARLGRDWGYIQAAGIVRYIGWQDQNASPTLNLTGHAIGWGVNVSSNVNLGKNNVGKFEVTYGHGIENYMNDAPVDIGIQNNFSNPQKPVIGVALPVFGMVSFLDHTWGEKFTTSVGYSMLNITNSDAQNPSDFHRGYYALGDLLYYPVKNVMIGGEYQWGMRSNWRDGFSVGDNRLQFSFKYSYSKLFTFSSQ
jgi:hypothetical protein